MKTLSRARIILKKKHQSTLNRASIQLLTIAVNRLEVIRSFTDGRYASSGKAVSFSDILLYVYVIRRFSVKKCALKNFQIYFRLTEMYVLRIFVYVLVWIIYGLRFFSVIYLLFLIGSRRKY